MLANITLQNSKWICIEKQVFKLAPLFCRSLLCHNKQQAHPPSTALCILDTEITSAGVSKPNTCVHIQRGLGIYLVNILQQTLHVSFKHTVEKQFLCQKVAKQGGVPANLMKPQATKCIAESISASFKFKQEC